MSGEQEAPHTADDNESEAGYSRAGNDAEEDEDVYAQLAQKERDLILAAELGKALLDSNQELQSRYDQTVDEFTRQVEQLQQEKHDLHLELEKMETEYQNAIKDLQDDMAVLRKQIRTSDERHVSEKERSRSLLEAQQTSDYLMEQIKNASAKEEELVQELSQEKAKNHSNSATIKDQMDHISMLREQVEYLSEKLRETNQKLMEIQGERDSLMTTLEATQEKVQALETQVSQQDEKIHRQTFDIEELQESNSELQQQLRQRQSSKYHHPQQRVQYFSNRSYSSLENPTYNDSGSQNQSQNLYFELNQEKHKENVHHQRHSKSLSSIQNQHAGDENGAMEKANEDTQSVKSTNTAAKLTEQSVGTESSTNEHYTGINNTPLSLMAELSAVRHHRRNMSDCSTASVTEGSRKRHHQNIGGDSDDEDGKDDSGDRSSGCKQSLYSDFHKQPVFNVHGNSGRNTMDDNGNRISCSESSQFKHPSPSKKDRNEHISSTESSTNFEKNLQGNFPSVESSSHPESHQPQDIPQEDTLFDGAEFCSQNENADKDNNKSLFSELSPYASEFYPRHQEIQEQSLFSELSSQLLEDRNGTGSDSSSSCMLGVFDFYSGCDSLDGDHHSNESLNRSMEMRSRQESDMSYVSDWYYMTSGPSEMIEDDDFECDDDDFLVGNMAGTTLSISDSNHGLLHYHCHSYNPGESISNPAFKSCEVDDSSQGKLLGYDDHDEKQTQLSEACRQLKELVVKVQGKDHAQAHAVEPAEASTEMLLSLVAEMRLCVDKLTAGKEEQIQSTDISTTIKDNSNDARTNTVATSSFHQDLDKSQKQTQEQNKSETGSMGDQTVDNEEKREEAQKQMRKSKSSSSLVSRKLF